MFQRLTLFYIIFFQWLNLFTLPDADGDVSNNNSAEQELQEAQIPQQENF